MFRNFDTFSSPTNFVHGRATSKKFAYSSSFVIYIHTRRLRLEGGKKSASRITEVITQHKLVAALFLSARSSLRTGFLDSRWLTDRICDLTYNPSWLPIRPDNRRKRGSDYFVHSLQAAGTTLRSRSICPFAKSSYRDRRGSQRDFTSDPVTERRDNERARPVEPYRFKFNYYSNIGVTVVWQFLVKTPHREARDIELNLYPLLEVRVFWIYSFFSRFYQASISV